uniref:Uncharacterized protein n=1 Tax=Hemiselmis andersenii TaxID=464988 RepID=A0A6U4XGF7_HEMAN|mmetsp:Transcript_35453/g.86359  ORF Transcript_35453/g.86359 Transcript_35453/m.86359 type:complete len:152 (+) Transcript_35453:249-704(+)
MSPIPDPPCGLRFCRQCNEFKPLSEFPAGKRRYQCRKHAQERQADVAELFRECDVEPCHRVLPADPLRALAGDNAVVVSREARKKLIREWGWSQLCSRSAWLEISAMRPIQGRSTLCHSCTNRIPWSLRPAPELTTPWFQPNGTLQFVRLH